MLGELKFEGDVYKTPTSNEYKAFNNTYCYFTIVFEDKKANDYVVIKNKDAIKRFRYLWHEVNAGRLHICTPDGFLKIQL